MDKVSIAQSLQDAKHNCGQSDQSESSSRLELCVVWTSAERLVTIDTVPLC
jgi:hypothetical protein